MEVLLKVSYGRWKGMKHKLLQPQLPRDSPHTLLSLQPTHHGSSLLLSVPLHSSLFCCPWLRHFSPSHMKSSLMYSISAFSHSGAEPGKRPAKVRINWDLVTKWANDSPSSDRASQTSPHMEALGDLVETQILIQVWMGPKICPFTELHNVVDAGYTDHTLSKEALETESIHVWSSGRGEGW